MSLSSFGRLLYRGAVPPRSSRHLASMAGPLRSIFPVLQEENHELKACKGLGWHLSAPCRAAQTLSISSLLCCLLLLSWFPKLHGVSLCPASQLGGFSNELWRFFSAFSVFLLSFSFYSILPFKVVSQLCVCSLLLPFVFTPDTELADLQGEVPLPTPGLSQHR